MAVCVVPVLMDEVQEVSWLLSALERQLKPREGFDQRRADESCKARSLN